MSYLSFLREYGSRYIDGISVTVPLFLISFALALVLAHVLALMVLSARPLIKTPAVVYIEFFRGTSLLVQLFWLFFVLPLFGVTLDKFTAGFLAVGLNGAAYGAELVRGAIQAVPRGQWEAAYALSLSPADRMKRIVLPQAFVKMLPAWGNLIIELLKSTALVSIIAVPDLMFQARQINGSTYLSTWAFGTALVIYYVLARLLVTPGMRWVERKMARNHGRS